MDAKTNNPLDIAQAMEQWSPRSGVSRSGIPLSINRSPAEALTPWFARLAVARVDAPVDSLVRCGMCNDLVFIRFVLKGEWTVTTGDGTHYLNNEPLLFGPQSRYMPLSCSGPMVTVGVGLKPGALTQLTGIQTSEIVDRIEHADPLGLIEGELSEMFPPEAEPEAWLETLENTLLKLIERRKPNKPDELSRAFELKSFEDPNVSVKEFAKQCGVNVRKLERVVKRDFGFPPKQVLRRARALDLAAQLCGVGDHTEEEELLLRYFDQSHLIREFAAFFGTTPSAFRSSPRPLMTLNVETRQARRLEILNRLKPGEQRPWVANNNP